MIFQFSFLLIGRGLNGVKRGDFPRRRGSKRYHYRKTLFATILAGTIITKKGNI